MSYIKYRVELKLNILFLRKIYIYTHLALFFNYVLNKKELQYPIFYLFICPNLSAHLALIMENCHESLSNATLSRSPSLH